MCAVSPRMPIRALPHVPSDRSGSDDATTGLPAAERSILQQHRLSMLIVGPPPSTEALLLHLEPSFADPMTFWQPGADLALPSGGTLLLRKVSSLTAAEQSTLLDWL